VPSSLLLTSCAAFRGHLAPHAAHHLALLACVSVASSAAGGIAASLWRPMQLPACPRALLALEVPTAPAEGLLVHYPSSRSLYARTLRVLLHPGVAFAAVAFLPFAGLFLEGRALMAAALRGDLRDPFESLGKAGALATLAALLASVVGTCVGDRGSLHAPCRCCAAHRLQVLSRSLSLLHLRTPEPLAPRRYVHLHRSSAAWWWPAYGRGAGLALSVVAACVLALPSRDGGVGMPLFLACTLLATCMAALWLGATGELASVALVYGLLGAVAVRYSEESETPTRMSAAQDELTQVLCPDESDGDDPE